MQRDAVDLERRRERDPRREALERPLQQLLGLLALELDRQLAGLQLVDQLDRTHAAASSLSRSAPARGRPASPSSSSLIRSQNARKSSPARRALSQPPTSPSTASSSSSVGTRRNTGPRDRRVRAEAAAQEDVVGLPPLAALVAHRRALEAEVADPVLGAGVRAAVEVEPQARRSSSPKRASRCLDERVEPRLRLGDREVAVRLAGAGDRGRRARG